MLVLKLYHKCRVFHIELLDMYLTYIVIFSLEDINIDIESICFLRNLQMLQCRYNKLHAKYIHHNPDSYL